MSQGPKLLPPQRDRSKAEAEQIAALLVHAARWCPDLERVILPVTNWDSQWFLSQLVIRCGGLVKKRTFSTFDHDATAIPEHRLGNEDA